MSGIAAAVCLDRPLLDPAIMPAMIDAIGYRGGDRIGTWHSGPAALGAAQLRTTAEARDELQPLACPDSLVHVVFDGFLSNWDDLRRELVSRGARLRTPSDTELVLRAYLEWGGEFATWLDGEFALIVWDARQRRLFAARDPVGARPLVYWCDGRTLLVASDPVAILAGLPERPALSSAYLVQVVTDLIYCAEDTPWDGVRRLRPAHLLRLENDRVTEERYWQPDLETHINYRRDSDYEEHYRSMLADCVRRAARSEAPTAFEVSGGLDSTSLFCMAHRLLATTGLPTPDIVGHTLAGPAGSDADEIEYVEAVERHTGRRIRRTPLFMPPLETFAAQARADADIPPYPNGAMSFALIEKAVADGSRVLVSGLGGDDWLVGVPVYYGEDLAARRFGAVFACLSDDLTELGARATASRFARSAILRVLPGETHDLARVLLHRRRPDELAGVSSWLSPLGRRLLEDRRDARETELRHFPAHHRYKIAKLTSPSFQMALRASERHAAHLGAELRSPMFSRPFIEFTLATPERLRQRGNRTKLLHRRAMQGIMPAKVLNRPDKAAFCLTFRRLFPDLLFLKVAPVPPGLAALLHDRTYLAELASRANALDDAPIYPVWAAYAAFLLSEAAA